MHVRVKESSHTCVYLCIYVYVCMCMYTLVHMHTYTHVYEYIVYTYEYANRILFPFINTVVTLKKADMTWHSAKGHTIRGRYPK